MRWLTCLMTALAFMLPVAAEAAPAHVHSLKITTLSTMLADEGLGEWGYAALVEADGHRILFDTGHYPDVVLKNAETLGIDLSTVDTVVISHAHIDHTGGLVTLRLAMEKKNPAALAVAHVAAGAFDPVYNAQDSNRNGLTMIKAQYEGSGARFVVDNGPVEIAPGIWFTGPVPRVHDERNWNPGLHRHTATGDVPDNVPEDAALVIATDEGNVILTGCGHAGIMNLSNVAQKITGPAPLLAVVGGLHLFAKPDAVLAQTATRLKGVRYLLAAHCTGIEATFKLRKLLDLDSRTAVVAAVGSSFTLGKGIDAGDIAGTPTS